MNYINFISSQCGAKECAIRFAGRWGSSSRHFATYMDEGINTYNLSRNENEIDPIRKLWVWKPCNFGDTVDACSNSKKICNNLFFILLITKQHSNHQHKDMILIFSQISI